MFLLEVACGELIGTEESILSEWSSLAEILAFNALPFCVIATGTQVYKYPSTQVKLLSVSQKLKFKERIRNK